MTGVVTTTMMDASNEMTRDEKTKKVNKKKDQKKLERCDANKKHALAQV
jgi:hypothetical protein